MTHTQELAFASGFGFICILGLIWCIGMLVQDWWINRHG